MVGAWCQRHSESGELSRKINSLIQCLWEEIGAQAQAISSEVMLSAGIRNTLSAGRLEHHFPDF